jgi:tetratricopeptide (TPR) repeat protein
LVVAGQNSAANNDFKTAIQDYKQVLTVDPTNIPANYNLGLAYLAAPAAQLDTTDRFASAIDALKTVTDQAPSWPGGFAQLGAAYAAKGDLANAIKAYRTSLDLDATGVERWLALAGLYDLNKQPAEATYARSRAQGLNVPLPAAPNVTITVAPTTTVASTTTATVAPTSTSVATKAVVAATPTVAVKPPATTTRAIPTPTKK